jgi:hypothetical protein
MSGFFSDVSSAALPVAIALLIGAAVARGALWANVDDVRARRYLEPLSTWCLLTLGVCIGARIAGGHALVSLVFPLVLAAVAAWLQWTGDTESEPDVVEPPAAPAMAIPVTPAATGHLWARPGNEHSRPG